MKKVGKSRFGTLSRVLAVMLTVTFAVSGAVSAAMMHGYDPEFTAQSGTEAQMISYPANSGEYPDLINLADSADAPYFSEVSIMAKDAEGNEVYTDPKAYVSTSKGGLGMTSSDYLGANTGAYIWNDFLIVSSVFTETDYPNRNRVNVYSVADGYFEHYAEWDDADLQIPDQPEYTYTSGDKSTTYSGFQTQDSILDVYATDEYIFVVVGRHEWPQYYNSEAGFSYVASYLRIYKNNISWENESTEAPTFMKEIKLHGKANNADTFNAIPDTENIKTFVINGKVIVFAPLLNAGFVADVSSDAAVNALTNESVTRLNLADYVQPTVNDEEATLYRITDIKQEGYFIYIVASPRTQYTGGDIATYYEENVEKFDIARVDFSDAFNPVRKSGTKFICGTHSGGNGAVSLARLTINGDYMYIKNNYSYGTNLNAKTAESDTAIRVFDASDRDNITQISTISLLSSGKESQIAPYGTGSAIEVVGDYIIGYGTNSYNFARSAYLFKLNSEKDGVEALKAPWMINTKFEAGAFTAIPYGNKIYIPYALTGGYGRNFSAAKSEGYNPNRAVIGIIDLAPDFGPSQITLESEEKIVEAPYTISGRMYNTGDIYVSLNGGEALEATSDYENGEMGTWSYTITEPGTYKVKVYADGYEDYGVQTEVTVLGDIEQTIDFTATPAEGVITFNMTGVNTAGSALTGVPIAAAYRGELLVGATVGTTTSIPSGSAQPANLGNIEVTLPEGESATGLNVRLFFWNGTSTATPILESVGKTVQ